MRFLVMVVFSFVLFFSAIPGFAELGFDNDYRAGAQSNQSSGADQASSDSLFSGRSKARGAEARQQKADIARKQYEQNMNGFKTNPNLGVRSSQQSICLSKPEEIDWTQMKASSARSYAQKMVKNMERAGCQKEAEAYMAYVISVVGEPEENEEEEIQILGASNRSVCGGELFNPKVWQLMTEKEAREAANSYANDLRNKPGCEPQAEQLLEYVETLLLKRRDS